MKRLVLLMSVVACFAGCSYFEKRPEPVPHQNNYYPAPYPYAPSPWPNPYNLYVPPAPPR